MRDAVELEVFKNIYHSIAEEMGAALRRTAFSPNIKERRDYSCAVFDGAGQVIAMGDHMPVHLGSMPMSVKAAVERLELAPGDIAMLNDPFCGGTHLPDVTLVAPVVVNKKTRGPSTRAKALGRNDKAKQVSKTSTKSIEPDFYVASRAHHADIGGAYAGSMGPCREIYQEGLRIPPVKLVRGGKMDREILALVRNNVRTPDEREGDLGAQIAACHTGALRLQEMAARYGVERLQRAGRDLLDYSEQMMRAFLAEVPAGSYEAEDFLDDDGVSDRPVRIAVKIAFRRGRGHPATVDFAGSDPQVQGSINAVEAITYSACFYVFRCLMPEDVPATAGLMRPIEVLAPAGTIVNARPPAAVAGGNVETSQRIVDVLLKALAQAMPSRVAAAASGTMNNLTIGAMAPGGGIGEPFAYYETIAGGMGARPTKDGVSGVHTHMTNSLNTPAEALEYAYPLRVTRYSLRRDSGGKGKHRGGDGIVREVEVLVDSEVTLLSDRRRRGPYGLSGGSDGAVGRAEAHRNDGSVQELPGKFSVRLKAGERIRIESPGGGGFGKQ
ncbi:MAG TPA: hydantoinase B/oxoprolinase family protein [Terriglobales bacterium]|nr:hydantoinase B/oxoprolinase family protein [Terriglobales bacterium]